MQAQLEQELLEKYASASNHKVIQSQADLNPKDRAMSEMLAWCRQQGNIVVLRNGNILTSNPSSRSVQNCKIVMINKGLSPGRVLAATSSVIQMLLANAEVVDINQSSQAESVSEQQQRLRMLVKEAVAVEATDIHIEVRPDMAQIHFRKHGQLYLHAEWIPKLGREVASVAFNKETDHAIGHFNPLIPQSASMPLHLDGKDVRLRLSSMPAHGGFDVVMRILTTDDEKVKSLEELGYDDKQIALIKRAMGSPDGAVIISGPTGSGKTTTLAAAMSVVGPDRKIFTIEDPVEKVVANATQVPVNNEHDERGFANMGRTALRMDPDVIVLGEMRDEDTAKVMVRAAITGHLVFSTLHTNSAPAIITRLMDMGISPSLLSDPNLLKCLICQRLIPLLCQKCAVPINHSDKHKKILPRLRKVFHRTTYKLRARGENCTTCNGLGIFGRTVVAEIIWVDEPGRRFIQNGDVLGWEHYLKEHGWVTYKDQALSLVKKGLVDPIDAEKVIGEISPALTADRFDYRSMSQR